MPFTRRQFLQAAAAAGAVAARPEGTKAQQVPQLDPNTLPTFVDPLPILPVAKPLSNSKAGGARYRIAMRQTEAKLHRDLPATRLWTFGGSWPGPTIETRSGQGLTIEWANELPEKHFLPIDHRLHGADKGKPEVRAVVHLHGGKTPPESDGWPEDWYVPGKSATYHYPNNQDPAMLWYHDHAMGINRLNIYAGLAGAYIIRDAKEDALNLPKGRFEIPLVLCDRFLLRDGSLDYPVSGEPESPWVPEVFGNAMTVNGKLTPFLDVDARKYRFRVLNASNGRFYHLSLSSGQGFQQIGADQGLLPAPIAIRDFVLAPAERLDVVIDFKDHMGEQIILNNDAFPMMQFRVGRAKVADPSSLPAALRPVPKLLESDAVQTRMMAINEYMDHGGESMLMLLNGSHWSTPITERPLLNSTEIWSITNPTEDSHPIHVHLVRFQILDRRPFDELAFKTAGQVRFTGPAEPPEPYEAGWKDTVRVHSLMVTRFIMRFEGYPGKYVYHCHVLEHEDNEMMRPFEVVAHS
ncbi:MAG TPA: multicopper oxidase [Bryobacteraceae bacterium]